MAIRGILQGVAVRLPDWPSRLDEYLRSMARARFQWGACDCVLFAAGAVQAVTGARPALPRWTTRRQALRELARRGGLAAATDAVLPRLAAPAMAQRGDLVLVQPHGQAAPALAVCVGHAWAAPGRGGVNFGDLQHATAAWGVR